MYHGSFAKRGHSAMIRQICATVIRPKMAPVVMTYDFMNGVYIGNELFSNVATKRLLKCKLKRVVEKMQRFAPALPAITTALTSACRGSPPSVR